MARVRRPLGMLVLLLAALAVDAAVAAPRRLNEEIRAAVCCVRDCGQLRGVACAPSCCAPQGEPRTATISTAARHDASPATLLAVEPPRGVDTPAPTAGVGAPVASRGGDPPPVFLLTRTLRL